MRRLVGLAVSALALVLPAGAGAAPTWLPQGTLSAPGDENTPVDVATAPDGTAIAVWQRSECEGQGETHQCKNGRARYSVRPPGGAFSPAEDLPGDPFASNRARPQVAVDGAGNAIAIWASGAGEAGRLRYSMRPAGGTFGGAKVLADPVGGYHNFPSLDMSPGGRAIVTFFRIVGGEDRASYAIREPGGDFGEANTLPGDAGATLNRSPIVHLDAAGGGIASWVRAVGGEGVFVHYATIDAGAAEFSPAMKIENGSSHDVAVAPSGAAVMFWKLSGSPEDLRYAFRSPGGEFGPPATLVEPDLPSVEQVAIAPDGSAVAAWRSQIDSDPKVRWAAAAPGGPFGPPTPLGGDDEGVLNDLEVSEGGTALLLWASTAEFPETEMRAALRPPGGTFGPSVPLAGPPQGVDAFGAAAAFDPAGNAVAVWEGRDEESLPSHDVPVLAAGLDAAGPRIGLGAPPSTRDDVLTPVSMSAFDVWSPIASTGFDFGDGAVAPGPLASHRFAAGLRILTATATDAVGNVSTLAQGIQVLDATDPVIRGLRLRPRNFRAARARTPRVSAARAGSTIRFHLSERVAARFLVQRVAGRGVKVKVGSKRRCLRRTPRNLRRGRGRCAIFRKVGRMVRRNRRAGQNRVRFTGRLGRRPLRPGRHRIVTVAIDRAGHRSARAYAPFRILPPKAGRARRR